MELAGRIALVTGGAVRMGRALCLALAERGCGVVIHCDTSLKQAHALQQHLRNKCGVAAWVVRARLSGEASCRRLIQTAAARAGSLDILVNNAAVFNRNGLFDADAAAWRSELTTNLIVPVLLTRDFAAASGAAAVINLLDQRIAGLDAGALPYSVSKKALEDFTRLAALTLAPKVRVNAVAPGPVLPREHKCSKAAREPAGLIPLYRRPTPEDVADAVLFLLGNDSVTGQTLYVDGGQNLRARQ